MFLILPTTKMHHYRQDVSQVILLAMVKLRQDQVMNLEKQYLYLIKFDLYSFSLIFCPSLKEEPEGCSPVTMALFSISGLPGLVKARAS